MMRETQSRTRRWRVRPRESTEMTTETRSRTRRWKGSWDRLPTDVSNLILSMLPVQAMCRSRAVCKNWNDFLRRQNREYLCLTHYLPYKNHDALYYKTVSLDDVHRRTMFFLDLESRRWHSMSVDGRRLEQLRMEGQEGAPPDTLWLQTLGSGTVCEFWSSAMADGTKSHMVMFDPLDQTQHRELPVSTPGGKQLAVRLEVGNYTSPAVMVPVVDNANHTFKVFLMIVVIVGITTLTLSDFLVYESCSNAWRGLQMPSHRVLKKYSAVFFQGKLYAVFCMQYQESNFVLMSFNLEENLWREVLQIKGHPASHPQLTISDRHLYMSLWSYEHHPPCFMFEIMEILVNSSASRSLVKISGSVITRITGELKHTIQHGFPLNSHSVVIVSSATGRLFTYDLRTGAGGAFPAHPVHSPRQETQERRMLNPSYNENFRSHYRAQLVSLRNILDK